MKITNNTLVTKEAYKTPSVMAIATNLDQAILDVSGTAGDLGDGGNIDLFGTDEINPLDIVNGNSLFF